MPIPSHPPTHSRLKAGILGLVVSLIALLPWWRNHDFLRDFYDYGLFINANARLAEGQRPHVDFITPGQGATFLLNYAAESAGGGTYLGLTRGAAALIIVSGLGLTLVLARRFNVWVAALLALAIVAGSASQHTIIFYNPLGVLALAMVVWSFAVAPLLRRETLGWHLLAAAGLFLGGTNKINFHLLACAMAAGWVVHAWIAQRPALSRVLLTIAFIGVFGAVLPIGLDIAWTGAGWQGWFYNVVQLPLAARGGRISQLFSPALYLRTVHDYYGGLRVPPIGLLGVLMPLAAVVAGLRAPAAKSPGRRRWFLIPAGLLAAFASSALLLTNNEIAYVTFAAALVITIGLWLGFAIVPRGGWFAAGVLLPAVILAAAGWESAWRGQRSQFGHEAIPRENYVNGGGAGPEFRYIRGLQVPPSLVESLGALALWRRALPGDEATRIFYGPGAEWLGHVWPMRKVPGLPLIIAGFDGPRENALITREVIGGDTFRHLVVMEAWDYWNDGVRDQLNRATLKKKMSPAFVVYHKFSAGTVSTRPLEFMEGALGGNVDGTRLTTPLHSRQLSGGRSYLGTDRGQGRIDVRTPAARMSAEYVLVRTGNQPGPLGAQLAVHANMSGTLLPRWSAAVTLPEGVNELVVRTDPIDGSGLPLTFSVEIPDQAAGLLGAGWRGFKLTDTIESEAIPPMLRSGGVPPTPASAEVRGALLPVSMPDAAVYACQAAPADDALVLSAGGEAWVKLDGMYSQIKISATLCEVQAGATPQLEVVFYKGGRLERFIPTADPTASTTRCDAWSPESGGWLGILAGAQAGTPAFRVKIEAAGR